MEALATFLLALALTGAAMAVVIAVCGCATLAVLGLCKAVKGL